MNDMLFNISMTAILTGIIKALIPDEKFEKQMRLLISVFFLVVCMIFFGKGFDLSFINELGSIETGYRDYSVQVNQLTAQETAKIVKGNIKEALAGEGIYPEKIYIDTTISDNDSIFITEVKLIFRKIAEIDSGKAVKLTKSLVGYNTDVVIEEG